MTSNTFDRLKIPSGFWTELHQIGVTGQDVLRKAHLPLTLLIEPVFVTTAQYFAIWDAIPKLIDDPSAGIIKFITNSKIAQWPPSLLASYHARNYRDALNRMSRYKQLCAPERFHITEKGKSCMIELEWLNTDQPEPPMLVYNTFVALLELGRRGTEQPLKASRVELSYPLGNVKALEDYFGCSIQFGGSSNRLTLHRSDLDKHFISYNAELLDILIPALDQTLEEQQRNKSITEIVKWLMKRNLEGGRPDIQTIANELGMSERTLQRRLTGEGTSFKLLLTEARHDQARKYLENPSLDIKEVAFLLGYEDQNSFYRAFRSWEGDTPSNWRAEQLGISPIPANDLDIPPIH
ncbi:helix-turn-helix domain-containing protein [Priestia megaterium]